MEAGLSSVSVLRGVVLWRHDQAATFPGAPVHSLDDVYHFLFVFHGPVDLVVVTSTQVNHDVLVPAKRRQGVNAHKNPSKKEFREKKCLLFPTITSSCLTSVKNTHSQEDPPRFRRWKQPKYYFKNARHGRCKSSV